jgi:hypothetical protein
MKIKDEWLTYQNMIDENDSEFLSQPAVQGTMFQSDTTLFLREFDYIREYNAEYLELMQDPTDYGSPLVFEVDNNTYNPNDIHHLYHVCRYENRVGKPDQKINILEWGGGYGNMCKVLHMILGDLIESYTIVDLPKFTKLTKRYLSNTCKNTENIFHIESDSYETLSDKSFDMFISTWALSESPKECSEYLQKNGLLDSKNMLVTLHQCGDHISFMEESTNLRNILRGKNTIEEDVSVIDGINYYIFR